MSDTEPTTGRSGGSTGPTPPSTGGAATPAPAGAQLPSTPVPGAPLPPRKPKIGDTMPAPPRPAQPAGDGGEGAEGGSGDGAARRRRRRRRGGGGGGQGQGQQGQGQGQQGQGRQEGQGSSQQGSGRQGGQGGRQGGGGGGSQGGGNRNRSGGGGAQKQRQRPPAVTPVEATMVDEDADPAELDEASRTRRRGKSRRGRATGRYQMNVHVTPEATHIAVLEGRQLVEHYVSRPTDDVFQIHGNIYLGKVENVLPGMEAAFVDIATPKNAVLYRGDVQFDRDDVEAGAEPPRIEQLLKERQLILCQVTKNPIAHKGARLTQEVSLPGRFVVLVPNSSTYGISKRLPDNERKRLRQILDKVKPPQHGVIVRTASENVTSEEIERDVTRLLRLWERIEELAEQQRKSGRPGLLYREPEMAVRVIREEFNADYRAVVIDDEDLHKDISEYVGAISPELADRVEFYDPEEERLPLFERFHVAEQLQRALDRKVWLPSGGSLIIEHTEALTVIDVNTGKNVGTSSLEETVFRNNMEAAEEIAKQLRLRDIGGIIVIDFIDMEVKENRDAVIRQFRDALARDKTRTQVFNISDLGLVEMTRKRIGEGLLESVADLCADCEGRGLRIPDVLKP